MDITFTCIGYKRTNPGKSKSKKLTIENIARLGALGFNWTSQEYVTRSFDEWIEDLKEYKRTHGHLSVNRHKDSSLFQFCTLRIIGYYIIIITLLYEITEQFHSMESSSSSSLSSTIIPRKSLRACIAALRSLTTKSQTKAPLPPPFSPIFVTECWAWIATFFDSSV